MDTRERFKKFTIPGYFSRVNSTHIPELHIGLDDKGRKAIELREQFAPRKVTGTTSIEVNQYKKPEYNTIRFSLIDDEVSGLFYKFCDDLIEQTALISEHSESYLAIINRYFQWKKMFVSSKKSLLTEPEIMGLIGEICFLRGYLAEKTGLSEALRSWSGQELTHKDFSYKDTWYEVKAICRGGQTVKISSLEQLESDNDGELVVFSLEKMSENYNGLTLNKLILETRDLFDNIDDREKFISKTALQGYEYNSYYDDFVYESSSCARYLVNDMFPKLTREMLPDAIRKAMYEIALVDISQFEINDRSVEK